MVGCIARTYQVKELSQCQCVLGLTLTINEYESDLPETITCNLKTEYDQLLSNTIKKNRNKHVDRDSDLKTILNKYSLIKCLQVIPHLKPENIDVDELYALLKKVFFLRYQQFSIKTIKG